VNAVFGYQYAAEKLASVRHKEYGGVITFMLLFAVHEVRSRFGSTLRGPLRFERAFAVGAVVFWIGDPC
jgi:hypothetical protein